MNFRLLFEAVMCFLECTQYFGYCYSETSRPHEMLDFAYIDAPGGPQWTRVSNTLYSMLR